MDTKLKIFQSFFQTFLDFLPCFSSFGNHMPALGHVCNLETGISKLEIENGHFPKLIQSLHQKVALKGLNGVFSSFMSNNGSGTRAQLLSNFGTR
ncbi:uncharacterized protein TNCT_28991 [Trichonephila clavata]|uniref:Uncharacterized protein n=1 Tax=Trichonephila clavata TaxID=2740835 RepID=A0A8X6HP53_TRICU|nr:uncharacterized protein TNCT_28991 [Trichonephila clavata]